MKTFYAAILALAITFPSGAPARADATLLFEGSGQANRVLVKNGKVRMETGEGEVMLYDERKRNVTMIDHKRRGYYVMDPQKMAARAQAMQGQMQDQMAQMQQQMAPMMKEMQEQMQQLMDNPDIPAAQKDMIRKQMEQMSGGAGAMPANPAAGMAKREPARVEATGKSRTVAGIRCRVHRVLRGSRQVREVCVASHQDAGISRGDYNTMRSMFALMREVAEKSIAAVGGDDAGSLDAFADYDGVPLESRESNGERSTLRSISTKRIGSDVFNLPSGYQPYDPFGQM